MLTTRWVTRDYVAHHTKWISEYECGWNGDMKYLQLMEKAREKMENMSKTGKRKGEELRVGWNEKKVPYTGLESMWIEGKKYINYSRYYDRNV